MWRVFPSVLSLSVDFLGFCSVAVFSCYVLTDRKHYWLKKLVEKNMPCDPNPKALVELGVHTTDELYTACGENPHRLALGMFEPSDAASDACAV